MGRHVATATAAVLVADTAVLVAGLHGSRGPFGLLTLLAYALLAWTAYGTGLTLPGRAHTATVVGAAAAGTAVQIVLDPGGLPQHITAFVVFLALPLLVGRYLHQHRTLVRTLDAHNRQLRTEQALLAEREQLRERLRIARDMHDSLGRRLSLVSVQAAALQVGELPAAQRAAIDALACSARDAVTELYQLIGSLRGSADDTPGADHLPALVAEFRAAGVDVTSTGAAGPLPEATSRAAYRVVEEGLTNAAKHAPGHPVAIQLTRETGSLLVTVVNPVTTGAAAGGGGYGLAGLAERVGAAGGFLDHRTDDGEFRLVAMLPTTTAEPVRPTRALRSTILGVATAVLLFALLPAALVTGVG